MCQRVYNYCTPEDCKRRYNCIMLYHLIVACRPLHSRSAVGAECERLLLGVEHGLVDRPLGPLDEQV